MSILEKISSLFSSVKLPESKPSKPSKYKISSYGIELIRSFEGLRLEAYPDTGGVWTIGWGTTLNVVKGMRITKETAEEWFQRDIRIAEKIVTKNVSQPLNQNQYDALCSFAYNIGEPQFKISTLLRLLNNGVYKEVPYQLTRWIYDDGKIVTGLVNRRNKEAKLFKGEINVN